LTIAFEYTYTSNLEKPPLMFPNKDKQNTIYMSLGIDFIRFGFKKIHPLNSNMPPIDGNR
jgi:hypothetical protein